MYLFLSTANKILLSKEIYNLHKQHQGERKYPYFKLVVPQEMEKWALKNDINNIQTLNRIRTGDILYYLNKMFVEHNTPLYLPCNNIVRIQKGQPLQPDINVYKSKANFGYASEMRGGEIPIIEKNYDDFMPDDIRNLDVWKKQTVELTNNKFRYQNKVPYWEASLYKRHYDRSNEGFQHADPDRASLNTINRGYNMDSIKRIANEKFDSKKNIIRKRDLRKDFY